MYLPASLLAICSTDPARPSLNHIYIDAQRGRVIATNGYMLAAIPAGLEEWETGGYVPAAAVKMADTQKGIAKGHLYHQAQTTLVVGTGASFPNPFSDDASPPPYPDWTCVVPALITRSLAINVDALHALAKVLCGQAKKREVALTWQESAHGYSPLLVTPCRPADGPFGVLMSIRPQERSRFLGSIIDSTRYFECCETWHEASAAYTQRHLPK